jgi:hypothetical protein
MMTNTTITNTTTNTNDNKEEQEEQREFEAEEEERKRAAKRMRAAIEQHFWVSFSNQSSLLLPPKSRKGGHW